MDERIPVCELATEIVLAIASGHCSFDDHVRILIHSFSSTLRRRVSVFTSCGDSLGNSKNLASAAHRLCTCGRIEQSGPRVSLDISRFAATWLSTHDDLSGSEFHG